MYGWLIPPAHHYHCRVSQNQLFWVNITKSRYPPEDGNLDTVTVDCTEAPGTVISACVGLLGRLSEGVISGRPACLFSRWLLWLCVRLARPPLNKKLFSVHRPSGLRRADWIFFLMIFENSFFPRFSQYILVNEFFLKKPRKVKKNRDLPTGPFCCPPGGQEQGAHAGLKSLKKVLNRFSQI